MRLFQLTKLPILWINTLFQPRSTAVQTQDFWPHQCVTIAAISLDMLRAYGITGIIFDLDNTIVSEDDRYLSPGAETWIATAKLKGIQCFILSNGKRRYRVKYWSQRLGISAISPARKPFPRAFRQALRFMRLSPAQVVVIGDSRHTDILGAKLVGCPSIQVASLPHPPRWWESLLGTWVQMAYPPDLELWNCEYIHSDS